MQDKYLVMLKSKQTGQEFPVIVLDTEQGAQNYIDNVSPHNPAYYTVNYQLVYYKPE